MSDLTYYQQKIIMKMIKRDYGSKQEINIETYLRKQKIKRGNMEKKIP